VSDLTNENKIIIDLCGGTGSWSKPYKDAGYDVRVITLPELEHCHKEKGRKKDSAFRAITPPGFAQAFFKANM
jgi:hypothetical protein